MNALTILLFIATILYMLVYQPGFYKYFFAILIPYYIFSQLFFDDSKINSKKKKFFISSWYHPYDSQIYCSSTVDVTKLLSFIKQYNEEHSTKIGITVFLMKLLANIFVKYPDLNGNIIFGNILKRNRIDISVTVRIDNGLNTEVITIQDANNLSLEIIKQKIDQQLEIIKLGLDVNLGLQKFFINLFPTFILQPLFRLLSILSATGRNLTIFGLPRYAYGTAVICNYGKEGLENTFLPLFPFSYSPICVGVSKIKEYIPKYESNEEIKGETDKKHYKCKFCYTMDHRFLNERIVAKLLNDINSTILNPQQINDDVYFTECSDISSTEIEPISKLKLKLYNFQNPIKKDNILI
jgi:hypothetical protein